VSKKKCIFGAFGGHQKSKVGDQVLTADIATAIRINLRTDVATMVAGNDDDDEHYVCAIAL